MTASGLLASWLAALIAVPLALLMGASGQGLGALPAGCSWIGVSVPWDRPVWALVNQPALNFASQPSAAGYWLGSTLLPWLVAALAMPLSRRLQSLAWQLLAVQLAWTAAVIGVLWQPALEPYRAHVTRWLQFRALPTELRFLTVALATAAVVPVVLRLLAIARITRHHIGRARRVLVIVLHLLPVPVAWVVVSSVVRGAVPEEAWAVAAAPAAVALAIAWVGYPAPLTHPVAGLRRGVFAYLAVVATLACAAVWLAGRPLPGGHAAALQWGREGSFNNIRHWMVPVRAPWLPPPSVSSAEPG